MESYKLRNCKLLRHTNASYLNIVMFIACIFRVDMKPINNITIKAL